MNLRGGAGVSAPHSCKMVCRDLQDCLAALWGMCTQHSAQHTFRSPPDGDGREGDHVEDEVDGAEEVDLRAGRQGQELGKGRQGVGTVLCTTQVAKGSMPVRRTFSTASGLFLRLTMICTMIRKR